ncbi:MAG: prepilin-type cleavage/methylation domain-containing protein [Oceanospirillaceae bacterium]|nr:prepilin-type cleavage/methylation domain-containing protein [Oceanospirillaceae bacterium]
MTHILGLSPAPVASRQQGFTMLELTVVLAVMALLAALTTPNLVEQLNIKRADLTVQDTQQLIDAARSFRSNTGTWPGGATCATAKDVLEANDYLPALPDVNRYDKAISTVCTGNMFGVVQGAIADWDGYLVNSLPGTTISNAATFEITTFIGIPGSEPGLANKLSRVATGDPEDNRMRTTFFMGGQEIQEAGDITFSEPDPVLRADVGSLTLSSASGTVEVAAGQTLTVDDVIVRSRGNRKLSESIPNYVQIGTYIVRDAWIVNKPMCGATGTAKASLRPASMRGGYTGPSAEEDLIGRYGYHYRLVDNGTYWTVITKSEGDVADYGTMDSLVDVFCYYTD